MENENGNTLVAIGTALVNGEYEAVSEAFFEYGIGNNIAITLPYGFTLEVEPLETAGIVAWDRYSMGIITSLMMDCGSVVLSLGRIEVEAFKLVRAICLFGSDFGLLMFVGPDPFLMTEDGQRILEALKCNSPNELVEMALRAFNAVFYDNCGIPIEVHPFVDIAETYEMLSQMGYVKQMLTMRTSKNRWLYPSSDMGEMAAYWCANYNATNMGVLKGIINPIKAHRLRKAIDFMPTTLKSIIDARYVIGRDGLIYDQAGNLVGNGW
jgi:hypothetical protein